jgi:hypothetical protein
VYALSQQFEEDGSMFSMSLHILGWLEEAYQEWLENEKIIQHIQKLQKYPNPHKGYTWELYTL